MREFPILTESSSIKNGVIEKKINNCIAKFSNEFYHFLTLFDIRIIICDIKANHGVNGRGCYYTSLSYDEYSLVHYICIDNTTINGVEDVFCHELGHFVDDVVGCLYNGKPINVDNLKTNKLSLTLSEYQEYARKEHDLFLQCKNGRNELIDNYDFIEIFAECYGNVLLEKRNGSLYRTKTEILNVTRPLISSYVKQHIGIAI